MPKAKYTRKRHSSTQNASYKKKADEGSTFTRKLINKCSQENELAKSTNTPPFDDSLENNTRLLLQKENKTTTIPNIISEQPMPSLADLEKMFEDSENSHQLSLTTSISSNKCEKSQLIKKNNANDMPLSMDQTVNKNIMLNESSTSNKNTTPQLEPVNRNSNFQIKKAFDNKPSSINIPCRTCKTNHIISKILDCQNPQMKTLKDLNNDENGHVNNPGTSRRHNRMSQDSCDSADSTNAVINEYHSLPLPSTSRENHTILKRFSDSLRKYGVDSPNFPKNSKESDRLLSEIIRKILSDALNDGTFDKCCMCFKIKLMRDFIQHESRNNPINLSVNEPYNLSHNNCCSKIEVNSGEMLNRKSKQTSKSSRINLGNCPICMDNVSNRFAVSTFCGHIFCMECITAAIAANGQKCPTCRKGLSYPGYHPLFL